MTQDPRSADDDFWGPPDQAPGEGKKPSVGAPDPVVADEPEAPAEPGLDLTGLVVCMIGSSPAPANQLVLEDPRVSPSHARIYQDDGALWIQDLWSQWGTFVNGAQISRKKLEDGDRISMGSREFFFEANALRAAPAQPGFKLSCTALSKVFTRQDGGRVGIEDISVQIGSGQFVGILGPSGCGKTTLLRVLASSMGHDGGSVTFDGRQLRDEWRIYRQNIAFVPQHDSLHPNLTVHETVRYCARLRGAHVSGDKTLAARVQRSLDIVGVARCAEQRVSQLSGGERKRVAVACELVQRPRVLFLDEPTAGLDPRAETQLMRALRDLAKEEGVTVVCSTHVMSNLDLFDQAIVLNGGRLVFAGTPTQIRQRFEIQEFTSLYDKLSALEVEPLPAPSSTATGGDVVAIPLLNWSPAEQRRFLAQTVVLLIRTLKNMLRDRQYQVSLIAQPVLIGAAMLVCLIYPMRDEFYRFFIVLAAVWFGISHGAREIVQERPIFARERVAGLNPMAYLMSKFLALQLIVAFVTTLLVFVTMAPVPTRFEWDGPPFVRILIVALTVTSPAVALGLLISGLARTERAATAAVPMVLIANILFSKVIVGSSVFGRWGEGRMSQLANATSCITLTRYGFALSGGELSGLGIVVSQVAVLAGMALIFMGLTYTLLDSRQEQ